MRTEFKDIQDIFTIPISEAPFPKKLSRDEAPFLLKGIQSIYLNKKVYSKVYPIIEKCINSKSGKGNGRKGMGYWPIFVLAVMRNGLNIDYDKLHYLANYDHLMRCVMGVETEAIRLMNGKEYSLTTIKNNVALLDISTINKINEIVVEYGHQIVKKKETKLHIKADTFVVETNIHFPTDIGLLWDSSRKCIDIAEWFSAKKKIVGWRKSAFWKKEIKRIFRIVSRTKKSGGKNKEERLQKVVVSYLNLCTSLNEKIMALQESVASIESAGSYVKSIELGYYQEMLVKHIDLVNRRLLENEVIPTAEKLYSIFESHTEWLSKGKAGKSVELGHNLLIATDQYHYILYHKVVERTADVNLTQDLVSSLCSSFPNQIASLSLDKGFYSKANKEAIKGKIPLLVMPKKGKRNKEETIEERDTDYVKLRHKHSAVESNINQLEHNGMGVCRDKTLKGFKRYASLSILAYNMHRLGKYICEKEKKGMSAKLAA